MIICKFAAVDSSELDRSGGGMEDPASEEIGVTRGLL